MRQTGQGTATIRADGGSDDTRGRSWRSVITAAAPRPSLARSRPAPGGRSWSPTACTGRTRRGGAADSPGGTCQEPRCATRGTRPARGCVHRLGGRGSRPPLQAFQGARNPLQRRRHPDRRQRGTDALTAAPLGAVERADGIAATGTGGERIAAPIGRGRDRTPAAATRQSRGGHGQLTAPAPAAAIATSASRTAATGAQPAGGADTGAATGSAGSGPSWGP